MIAVNDGAVQIRGPRALVLSRRSPCLLLPNGVNATFALESATPYPTGVVGLDYTRKR